MEQEREYTILDQFFNMREEELAEQVEEDAKCLDNKLKPIKQEDIVSLIEQLPEQCGTIKQELMQKLDDLVCNYNVKIAYYNKKYYKQGFKDAVELKNLT